ncbi:MAG TPA: DUF1643 domain-containing protein [Methylomirabilota bacterium]|jgi:hypothetical protein|nr:DUF1643 domain-containing protein [Methylomirabilota bacterium]
MSWVATDAVIDETGRYRYALERIWKLMAGRAVWIMLNPSTADAEQDDATIRRCIGFTRAWGLGGIIVVNLFAYRATNPRRLLALRQNDAVGPQNDEWLGRHARGAGVKAVIAAWGAHGSMWGRDTEVLDLLRFWHVRLQCLGRTKAGAPRHPLRLAYSTALEEFSPC